MLKILQWGFNSTWTINFPMFKLDLEKAEKTKIKLSKSIGSWKKQESTRETSTSALLTTEKPLTVCITKKTEEFSMRIPGLLTCLLRNLCAGQEARVRTGHGITGCFQIGKGLCQGVYCHPAYLTSVQSTSCEMPGWMNHRLESRLLGEISITSDMQMTTPLWHKTKKN